MTEPRLRTELWIQACIRRADLDNIPIAVLAKGDASAGAVLVKQNRFEQGCVVLTQGIDGAGRRGWFPGTGPAPVPEAEADAYIARARQRDPDLWVIEIEDRRGRLPFDDRILGA
jgi:GMP synthase (glutamine-hydrolysing)